jgi:hypothetical protein
VLCGCPLLLGIDPAGVPTDIDASLTAGDGVVVDQVWVSAHQRAGRVGGNMNISQFAAGLAIVAVGPSLAGCLEDDNHGAIVGCTEQGSIAWSNGIDWSNGVQWSNGVSWSNGAIWSYGLASVQSDDFACRAESLQLFEYTVGCALRADQRVDVRVGGQVKTIGGRLGLAPEWSDGPCDAACRGWVSACLIASLNGKGERVEIAVSGHHPALGTDPVPGFTVAEATFYGDVFADPPQLHACLAPGVDNLERSCAGRSDCPIAIAGACADVCDARGCRADGRLYKQAITTSLMSDPIHVHDAAGAAELRKKVIDGL